MLHDYLGLILLIGLFLYVVREWWPLTQVINALVFFGIWLFVCLANGVLTVAPYNRHMKVEGKGEH
jgi:hypothetical protein